MLFKRLLVANRGEIAIRIFRAATELEIRTIGIYSHEDRFALHRFKADEAYKLGEAGKPIDAYLNWQQLIEKAKKLEVDAIHPGYGFLSENDEFAAACEKEGITFVGPSVEVLRTFGDKLLAKKAAKKAGLPIIPGSDTHLRDLASAEKLAQEIGYPVTLKALSGGGGKGIRQVKNSSELRDAFERAQSEAKSSFGRAEIYLEKTIVKPRHIEVQIMGDHSGNIVHLYERDCSVQRRHQKVIEVAPALGIKEQTRKKLLDYAVTLAKNTGYYGLGTIEFLVDQQEQVFFLEVNPRVQVEHTVTEMITGRDLVQASIVIAAGRPLSHPAIGITSQEDIVLRGHAIQARITTEDPTQQFTPDTGRIIAYRPAQGFGIRLDDGQGTTGGVVTPHYDSLLVKVTAFGLDLYGTAQKMLRALREFRIRGVKQNIPLLINVISHANFRAGNIDTAFLDEHPELFRFKAPKDRATKLLRYIANATINNPHELSDKIRRGEKHAPELVLSKHKPDVVYPEIENSAREIFLEHGVKGLNSWISEQQQLLLTDTTMRDAHQSLFATRLRNRDILKAVPFYNDHAAGLFSLEVWGGATFDTALRFLREDPWERLAKIREKAPRLLLQMLLRGDNAVGYTNYPEWVIRDFIRLTADAGLDLFRIFDCLNNTAQMSVAMDEVKKRGAIVEACICYTGNVSSPQESKYTLKYYLDIAKELETMGSDMLCIKDMAGLLRPQGARALITALKEHCSLPIHLHTHATSGNSEATLLAASEVGCDIVDGAISSMSGLTSQPSLNAIVAALEDSPKSPAVALSTLDDLGRYWEGVRSMYQMYDPGIKATSTRVYEHEIPGGQYSNLYDQARRVGVSANEFFELTERYREVNELFGDIIKVTPSSKVVGDLALLLQKHGLTGKQLLESNVELDYPDSVVSFFKGHMGVPYGGFPEKMRELVLGANPPPPEKPVADDNDSLDQVREELAQKLDQPSNDNDVLSYRLYPKVYMDYFAHNKTYGKVEKLPTPVFFYGMETNEEIELDLEQGKTLIINLRSISEPNDKGERNIYFELNGYPRTVAVVDESLASSTTQRRKAEPENSHHIGAAMPGKVLEISCAPGDQVKRGDKLLVTESMKMEYVITAKIDGKVGEVLVGVDDAIENGDLLISLEA